MGTIQIKPTAAQKRVLVYVGKNQIEVNRQFPIKVEDSLLSQIKGDIFEITYEKPVVKTAAKVVEAKAEVKVEPKVEIKNEPKKETIVSKVVDKIKPKKK